MHMAILSETNVISADTATQARCYLIFTTTSGRCPLRARNTIEFCGDDACTEAQPQCVSRSKLNLRRRNLLPTSITAAEATTTSDTVCCQSIPGNITPNQSQATNDSTRSTHLSCHSLDKLCKPILLKHPVLGCASRQPLGRLAHPPTRAGATTFWCPNHSRIEPQRPCQRDAI